VTARGGGTVVTSTPDGIANAFAGVVSFNVSGVTPGGSNQATISFPSGLPADSGNAYLRFNYSTNRFEEFVDANGNPLYSFVDSDGDGSVDSVSLTLIDGDPTWDGDGSANGTVVDPGFLGRGDRILTGTKRGDTLTGNVLANTLISKKGKDLLIGDLGNDILIAGRDNDRIHGGEGADQITGGKGRDRFIYNTISDSTTSLRDTVKFGTKDRFVFRSFDGNSNIEGQQQLAFIGKQTFSGIAGELRATRSVLEADLNGDSLADFAVNLRRNTLITGSNLVL
jgi:Ca2+-binding RTX toxin-like protein